MTPGTHQIIIGDLDTGVRLRAKGLHVRDGLLVLAPGPTVLVAWLVRSPLDGPIVPEVLRSGLGALNIDACRVRADLSEFFSKTGKPRSGSGHAEGYGIEGVYGGDKANPPHVSGRWPPNLVLVHALECTREGTRRVQGTSIPKGKPAVAVRRSGVHAAAKGHQTVGRAQPVTGHSDADGTEAIASWTCADDCPVPLLDADSGTTSRFFPQFAKLSEALDWLSALVKPLAE